jgi:hypothetical protein
MIKLKEDWEFNVFGVYNYNKPGRFDSIIKFIRDNHMNIDGDILEAGVFRGSSLLAIGMLLRELGSTKKVYGFDSFSGFPPIHNEKDEASQFEVMYKNQQISSNHIKSVRKNQLIISSLNDKKELPSTDKMSSSTNFNDTSKQFVQNRIDLLELDNIILVDGPFSETMQIHNDASLKLMAVILDCDLYQSYIETFKFVWKSCETGAFIFLDEYYSLKFPGARVATDEFLKKNKSAKLIMDKYIQGDFERWHIIKS